MDAATTAPEGHLSAAVDDAALHGVNERLQRSGVEVTARRQWPTGMAKMGVALSGRIDDGPLDGRAIGRLTDLGWGPRLRRLLDDPDALVPDEVVRAAVATLADWPWQTRPVAVTGRQKP